MTQPPLRRLVYITSGAVGMFCGSCLNDNTLARAMLELGCDVELIPLYTPIRTDEQSVAVDKVFFGGVNVYLQQYVPLFRYLPRWLDRWLDQPWLLRWVASGGVKTDYSQLAGLAISVLRGTEGNQKKEVQRLVDWIRAQGRPDAIIFTNILIAASASVLKRELGCPVFVTLQGDDVFLSQLAAADLAQAKAAIAGFAGSIQGFLAHSQYYADEMAAFLGLPHEKIHVVPLGLDPRELTPLAAPPSGEPPPTSRPPTIGYLARIAPEKGLHLLAEAFALVRQMPGLEQTRLRVAGWLGNPNLDYAEKTFARLREIAPGGGFEYVGEVDRRGKGDFLRSVDLLSTPTIYREPKGIFVLEALAAGTPVVQPAHGAFPEMLAELGGGLLFEPHDPADLARRLAELLRDPPLRRLMGESGRQAVLAQRNSRIVAEKTLQTLAQLIPPP